MRESKTREWGDGGERVERTLDESIDASFVWGKPRPPNPLTIAHVCYFYERKVEESAVLPWRIC